MRKKEDIAKKSSTYIQHPSASFVTLVSVRIDDFASEYKLCARVNIPLITDPI